MVIPDTRVTMKEAAEALTKVMRLLPPSVESEIGMIKKNPSLTWFQKRRLIHAIRRSYGKNNT